MSLPSAFRFSQASLQDYHDCRRRFELRYLDRLPWPAIEIEPVLENERYMLKGAAFHHLVRQHQLGLPVERLAAQIKDEDLSDWWQRYLESVSEITNLPGDGQPLKYPEQLIVAPLAGYSLVAKYDLLLIRPGEKLRIVDWKTSRHMPKRRWLADRLQTRVYRFLAVSAASHLNGGLAPQPDQVEMVYWFTQAPHEPEIFPYSLEQYQADRASLTRTIEQIAATEPGNFPLTPDETRCRFCVYRSLCDRGVSAGGLDELPGLLEDQPVLDLDASLDFDQIAEIEF